jgi:hypothetical protein
MNYMYPDRIPSERLQLDPVRPLPFNHAATDDGGDKRAVPPLPNLPAPNSSDNPEFTKWWRRWVSRVRTTALRNPARRFHIGRKNKPKADDKAAQPNAPDKLANGNEGADTFTRADRGEVRHRNHIPPPARVISGEAEFKRYLL